MKNYRPLPDNLTIRKSKIEGLGLFAYRKIPHDTILGMTHYKKVLGHETEDNLIRTPLGGFINHSDTPNCELIDMGRHYVLRTTRFIKRGEELSVTYRWYNPTGEEEWMTLFL